MLQNYVKIALHNLWKNRVNEPSEEFTNGIASDQTLPDRVRHTVKP